MVGLNRELDDVCSRILGRRQLSSTREVFSEVRREEQRRKVMSKESLPAGPISPEASALVSKNSAAMSGPRNQKGRPWCEHCHKSGHTKEAGIFMRNQWTRNLDKIDSKAIMQQ